MVESVGAAAFRPKLLVTEEGYQKMCESANKNILDLGYRSREVLAFGNQIDITNPKISENLSKWEDRVKYNFLKKEDQDYWVEEIRKINGEFKKITKETEKEYYMAVLGNGNSGKSTILNAISGAKP